MGAVVVPTTHAFPGHQAEARGLDVGFSIQSTNVQSLFPFGPLSG